MSFPLPPLEKHSDTDYEVSDLLGRGNYVSVYSAVHKPTQRNVALKVLDRYRCEKLKKTPDLLMEKHCLRRTNHANIIKMLAYFTDTLTVYVVLEECIGGELWDAVKTVGCPDVRARFYFAQILSAMEYLRQAGIVHRDIKAENMMLTDLHVVKLIDFGTAKDLENPHIKGAGNVSRSKVFQDYVGTPQFMAPEIIENKCSDFRSDTWALGCCIYQVLVGCPPFHAASEYLVFLKITDMKLEFPPGINPDAKDIIQRMVVKDADARLGGVDFNEIKEHPYFSGTCLEKASERSLPVRSLVDCCLHAIGTDMKKLQDQLKTYPRREEFPKPVRDVLERMRLAQKWQDDVLPPEEDM